MDDCLPSREDGLTPGRSRPSPIMPVMATLMHRLPLARFSLTLLSCHLPLRKERKERKSKRKERQLSENLSPFSAMHPTLKARERTAWTGNNYRRLLWNLGTLFMAMYLEHLSVSTPANNFYRQGLSKLRYAVRILIWSSTDIHGINWLKLLTDCDDEDASTLRPLAFFTDQLSHVWGGFMHLTA